MSPVVIRNSRSSSGALGRLALGLALSLGTVACAREARTASVGKVDLLIKGGTVVDGTGAPARVADVGIRGDSIVYIGDAASDTVAAVRTVDATGLVVAPGFIDAHTHTAGDLSNAERRANLDFLMQGVTTVATGNDGSSPLDIADEYAQWTRDGIGPNAALFIGEGSVRRKVMGMSDAKPSAAQLDSMRSIVARAMNDGALGLSTGLYYAPGSYASTDEVIELAKVAAEHGGIYDTHMRDESSYNVGLVGAVEETIRIGREAHIPVHISHIKALGTDVWGQSDTVIAVVNAARAGGVQVSACQYPYTASGTSIGSSLLPRWAEAGGRDSLLARIGNSSIRDSLVKDMRENLRRRGGAEALLITGRGDTTLTGKTLAQVAAARKLSAIDAALEIVRAGDASVASFNMKESDIDNFMVQPWVATCSDGSDGHPRKYGTFPRKLREYVYRRHLLTIEQAVHVSSELTAQTLQLDGRGSLAVGKYADVIVFDPATVTDRSTYEEPRLLATGMRYVLVNGKLAIDGGEYTGALAGRALKPAPAGGESASAGQ
jgi:N-acyl-D-amino-acid deacylase